MTYEEIVDKVRFTFENADAREIFEHIAIQVNILGEGQGAFYIEVADRSVVVEPYDYYDRDGLVTGTGETMITLAEGGMKVAEAFEKGLLTYEGNRDKLATILTLKIKKYCKKTKKK